MIQKQFAVTVTVVLTLHIGVLSLVFGMVNDKPIAEAPSVIQGVLISAVVAKPPEPVSVEPLPKPPSPVPPIEEVVPPVEPVDIVEKVIEPVKEVAIEPPPEELVPVEPVETKTEPEPETETETELNDQPPPTTPVTSEPAQQPVETIIPPRVEAYQSNNPPPKYPRLSKRLKEEGTVILELLIAEDGTVAELKVKRSSGFPRLDKAALKAVKRWRYTPALRGDTAIAYRYEQPVSFTLK